MESHHGEPTEAPLLKFNYSTGSAETNSQKVGLRFQDIAIPQGATITSAYLEFTAAVSSSDNASMLIQGQSSGDAATFATTDNNISGTSDRPKTTNTVAWNDIPAWTLDTTYQSPDITTVVQEIVNHTDWCGDNNMAFFLIQNAVSDAAKRIASAYDGSSANAPRLHINYDEEVIESDTVNGCINQTFTARVISGNDDAEEYEDTDGTVVLGSSDLELVEEDYTQTVGIRFRSINIPKDTTILEASLTFTANETDTTTTSLTIRGHGVDDSDTFSTDNRSVSSRLANATGASVTWSPTAWNTEGEQHVTPDLRTIVAEITTLPGWESGNDMTFLITGTGKRVADSFDDFPSTAPYLKIKVEGKLGTGYTTVRDRLITTVDSLSYKRGTPIQDTLYEAARYWRGEGVYYGRTRGFGYQLNDGSYGESHDDHNAQTRISHTASYSGGTVERPTGCTDNNLNSDDCIDEYISGNPIYTTPIDYWCQNNYQVLLTDGEAGTANSAALINTMVGSDYACSGNYGCSQKLVEYLHIEDQNTSLQRTQTIDTHTIGFNFLDGEDLSTTATAGGGGIPHRQQRQRFGRCIYGYLFGRARQQHLLCRPGGFSQRLQQALPRQRNLLLPISTPAQQALAR